MHFFVNTLHLFVENVTGQNGEVIAIERDPKRCDILRKMMRSSGGFEENVQVLNKDFTALNTEDYAHVEYIVLDPSCSGSGKIYYATRICVKRTNDIYFLSRIVKCLFQEWFRETEIWT